MLSFIRSIIAALLTLVILVFSISNRHSIDVFWNPMGEDPFALPLYLVALGFMTAGFVIGALLAWLGEAGVRRERRSMRKKVKGLEKELQAFNEHDTPVKRPSTFLPALLNKKS